MRIINLTDASVLLSDLDQGNTSHKEGMAEYWNAKSESVVPGNGYIDVFDTDKAMLSSEYGQIAKLKTALVIDTAYSITGTKVGPFDIVLGVNDTFEVTIGAGPVQSFVLPSGSAIAMSDIVTLIMTSATGFTAAESSNFYRASNVDNVTAAVVEGDLGEGYGQRGVSIVSGFLALYGPSIITIGAGTANATLGFYEKQITKVK